MLSSRILSSNPLESTEHNVDIRGKGHKLQEENYVQIEEVGTIGTKEMEGPDKSRKDKQS